MITRQRQARPEPASGTGRRALARRHWPFAVLLAAGLALRLAAQLAYQPALVYIDSARYLGADQRGLDPLGYSYLLLRPVLVARGGLAGVAVIQHALGLAMAVCLYLLAVRLCGSRWLGLLAAAPVLLDAYQVQAEQMIMPDVLFEALIVAAVTVLLWRPDPGLARLVGAAALLGASATVRQVGEVLALPLLVYVVAATPGWRRRAVNATAALAVFALPVVAYMALSASVAGNGLRLSDMDDAYLYGRVAHAADCAALRLPAYERPLCPPAATAAALGVDGLATDPRSAVFTYRPPAGISRGAATRQFDEAVLTQQPLRVAGDVASDAIKVFALTRDTAHGDPPVSRWQFQASYPAYGGADAAVLGRARPRVVTLLADALRAYQLHGGYTPGPLLLAFLFLGTLGCFSFHRQRTAALGCALATGLAVAALLGADLYEFSWRYQLPALVTLPLAGTLGAASFIRLAVTRRSDAPGTMNRCTLTRTTLMPWPNRRSGRSRAASSTPTTGSGSAGTTSSAATAPAERTPSSNGATSPWSSRRKTAASTSSRSIATRSAGGAGRSRKAASRTTRPARLRNSPGWNWRRRPGCARGASPT